MNECIIGWMAKCMDVDDERMDGKVDCWLEEKVDVFMDGWMNKRGDRKGE